MLPLIMMFMVSAALSAPPPNYVKVWEDTFSGTQLDSANWTVGCKGANGDLTPGAAGQYLLNTGYDSYITAEDVYVSGGNLYLRNQKRNYVGTDPAGNYNYTTGWIQSMHKVYFNKGYVEFRAQFPSGDKVWPALWLIAEDLVWGPEWDMWEYFGYRSDIGYDTMGNHLLYDEYPNEKWKSNWINNFDTTYDCEAWHIYGFEWTDTEARFFIDGVLVNTILKSSLSNQSLWPDEGMYFVLNNSTKTASPDTNTTWPNHVVIDYVELYTYQSDSIPPANPTGLAANAGNGFISLNWDDNTEPDLANYGIYRSTTSGGPYTHLIDTPSAASEYVDNAVANGVTYYYVVTAIDTSVNESGYSNETSGTPSGSGGNPILLVGGATLNGDFNNPAVDATFAQLANWVNIGSGGSTINATKNNNAYDGTMHATLGYLPGSKIFAVDTAYILAEGDSFDVSYVWKDGWLWNDNSFKVSVSLFTTDDDTINGTRTDLVTDYSLTSSINDTYEAVDHNGFYSASASAAGKKLFVAIDTTITGEAYAMMDNFELTVTPAGGGGNQAPTANAGPDQSLTDTDENGSEDVTLDGSGSSDSDGTIVSYVWETNGVQIATGATPTVTLPVGAHTIDLTVTDNESATGSDSVLVTVNAGGPVNDHANADIIGQGTVTGSYVDTQASDNSYESISERESGGNPNNRHSHLEHKWTINVTGGDSVTFYVEAHHTANSEGDDFVFAYSTDNVNFTDMVTVTKTADNDTVQQFTLPNTLSGTVYIRVKDTDQSQGNKGLDTVYVDDMYIRSDGTPPPNQAPSFNSDPAVEVNGTEGAAYNATLANNASDPEGDPMTFSRLPGGPSWLSVASDGTLSGTPGAGDVGLNSWTVQVDATGGSDTATLEITVDAVGSTPDMYVSNIAMSSGSYGGSRYSGIATITILDDGGSPVSGAAVNVTWSGAVSHSQSASTDGSGVVVFESNRKKNGGTFTVAVDNVTASGYSYNAGLNIETSDSITAP
jgi:beta-glucanase (GH16 family)